MVSPFLRSVFSCFLLMFREKADLLKSSSPSPPDSPSRVTSSLKEELRIKCQINRLSFSSDLKSQRGTPH
ncbi:hypothetical protein RRG08_002751 [Elysia crispata]|uniref:Uncharacterized protein n=1 Tax=Elysia crispata TaxID=231223 RepID=A0AAE1CM20_9GAST|nr:hypothetical protein RRG08_002751 [Elysia crispata]